MDPRFDATPQMQRRIVFAAVQSPSFQEASRVLSELCDVDRLPKRIWRMTQRIGQERVAERVESAETFQQLPLPAQQQSPVERVPELVCVQPDGGRYQRRERGQIDASRDSHWREFKAGCLLTMASPTHAVDPCPELPASFADPGKMRQIAAEIKGFTTDVVETQSEVVEEVLTKDARQGRPAVLVRSVVTSGQNLSEFGRLLASAAYERGFHAAPRKAYVADGAEANWSLHARHFSHYTPVLDFVHALMYVYAAAMSQGDAAQGWSRYRDWAQWLWSGKAERVIAALEELLRGRDESSEGPPPSGWLDARRYLTHHAARMRYDAYRRSGLPITSCHIESTIKQINRRVKGTEKFWSDAEPMLALLGDHLSETTAARNFWLRRSTRLTHDCYHQAG